MFDKNEINIQSGLDACEILMAEYEDDDTGEQNANEDMFVNALYYLESVCKKYGIKTNCTIGLIKKQLEINKNRGKN